MKAWCLIREQPHYRRDAFEAGLKAAGYQVNMQELHTARIDRRGLTKDDRLVVWNRYGTAEVEAKAFEAAGGRVIVAENGYLKGRDGKQNYAIALDQHNGGGVWPDDGGARFAALGVELKDWREDGGHILVCPNRPFGAKGFAMHPDWAVDTARTLAKHTKREVRIHPHPGNWQKDEEAIRERLRLALVGCWAVVTWASSAGVHALLAGVPVIREARWWILHGAAGREVRQVENTPQPDRSGPFRQLACAQWTVEEIAAGEPFRALAAL